MKLVYISGPFRSPNAWEIEQNIRRAEEIALEVWKAGAAVICPHANTRFFQGTAADAVWLKGDLEMVRRCDAIVTAPGWNHSRGAQAEIMLAHTLALPVFHSLPGPMPLSDAFLRWLTS